MSAETKSSSALPVDPQMPGSNGKAIALPIPASPVFYASKADETIIRLAKLIKTTAGLSSLLSVSAYSLYVAAYLHAKSPTRGEILVKLAKLLGRPAPKLPAGAAKTVAGVSPFAPLISVVNDTRFAIRLTGLVPLYVLLRTLLKQRNPKDAILHKLAIVQAVGYIIFQVFENLWLLSTRSVLSPQTQQKLGGVATFFKWSCRAWFVALSCDLGRLAREAMLAKQQGLEKTMSKEEKEQAEKKWWAELFSATAWLPMAVHYGVDGGIGLNQGLVGLSGMLGGIGGLSRAWIATKD